VGKSNHKSYRSYQHPLPTKSTMKNDKVNIEPKLTHSLENLEKPEMRRNSSEEALREATTHLQLIFRNMINAFVVWESVFDEHDRFISFRFGYFNDAYARITKLKLDDVQGKDVFEVWPETEESWVEVYGDVAMTGLPKTFEMYHKPTNGLYRCNAYRPGGTPDYVCVIFEDITEENRAAEVLKESGEKYRALIETTDTGYVILDGDGNVLDANRIYVRLTGHQKLDEIRGRNVTEWTAQCDAERNAREIIKCFKQGYIRDLKIDYTDKAGRATPIEINATVIETSTGQQIVTLCRNITERKRAEEALQLNTERTETLLQLNQMTTAPLQEITDFALEKAVQLTNSTIGYLAFLNENESILTMHSWSRTAMAECAIAQKPIHYPVAGTGLWGEAVRQRKPIITNDYALPNPWKKGCPDGHVQILRHMNVPVLVESRIVLVAGVGNKEEEYDVTDVQQLILLMEGMWRLIERKRTEEALRESENKYRLLADNSADVIFIFDLDMKVQYISPSVKKLRGFFPEDIIGQFFSQSVTDESSEYIRKVIQEEWEIEKTGTADPKRTRVLELEMLCKDGSTVWTEVKASFLRNDGNNPIGVMGIIRDITERKQTENQLRKSEELFKKAFYTSPDSININRLTDGMYISINKGFSEITGYSDEDVLGKTSLDLNIWHDTNDRAKLVEGLREKGKVENLEARFRLKNGEIKYGMMSATLIDLDGVPHILNITRDITQWKRSEEEKTRLELQLFQAQKMEAIGTLAAGIAHDFNNILTALVGYAALLRMKIKSATLHTYVDHILSASHKATDLVQNLLAFSKQQAISLKPISLHNTIRGTEKLLKRLVTEDIAIRTLLATEDITIMADATQIDQILFNLVTNARDAMPQGGTLTIETKSVELDDEFHRIHGYGEPGRYALFSISDTGVGIDKTTREKIFDPFFTTKEVGKGTGLGLSTVYGIVKQHNGYITVNSEPNAGTTFHIYLPVANKIDNEENLAPTPMKGGNETILVAEDNEAVRGLISKILIEYGYTTVEAIDGAAAIEEFKKTDKIDLLILDSIMPKKNGREAYNEIHKIKPDIRVIFTSGYTKDVFLDKGIEDKKFNFLQKPISPDTLLKKVREVLDDRQDSH
jgi:two-component system cell cycle sensor histidine kinase/response regulator CckA